MKISNFLFSTIICFSCAQSHDSQYLIVTADSISTTHSDLYELMPVFNGVLIEKFDSSNIKKDRYNSDNKIFTEGSVFKYSFQYIKNDTVFSFHGLDHNWHLIPKNEFDNKTINTFQLHIPKSYQENYPQTVVNYYYPPNKTYSSTGVIENKENIWLHPPRDGLFRILELNPFPYIKMPLKIGNKWKWKMEIGDHWSDKRWKEWSGTITNNYSYEVIDKRIITTSLGNMDCYVIKSEAKNELGKTYLNFFFNSDYGFVKLDYINIDGSEIKIFLDEKLALTLF